MNKLSDRQQEFLDMAHDAGVDPQLFDHYQPEVQYVDPQYYQDTPRLDVKGKPKDTLRLVYIHTGGTLMMVPSTINPGALSFDGAIGVEKTMDLLNYVFHIREKIRIMCVYISNIDSREANIGLWRSIIGTIQAVYKHVDGVVIGHGTHTATYTASALAFALRNLAIPIVVTAAQMPINAIGSDGLANLTGAIQIAASANVAEVLIYGHGEVHRGVRAIKKHDSHMGIFGSPSIGPIGHFTSSGVQWTREVIKRDVNKKTNLQVKPHFTRSVTVVVVHPGLNRHIIQALACTEGNLGLIIETYGNGAIPDAFVQIISEQIRKGFPVFVTSSCASGATAMDTDDASIDAQRRGVIVLGDISSGTAAIKLMHILGNYPDATFDEIIQMMKTPYVKEMNLGVWE